MNAPQWLLVVILLATVAMFLWGKWRHDMVAVGALLACVLAGLVPAGAAFSGFSHPAVVTVACVLVLSQGLQNSGAVDALTRLLLPTNAGRLVSLLVLMGLGAFFSGFMNNVGAMALLMPVAIHVSQRLQLAPGQILMPLAFATILGGMTTLIGTPPNLIVSGFRGQIGSGTFSMFDFTPVGLAVAIAGVLFVALLGWRLVPRRQQSGVEGFESSAYITEVRVHKGSKADGASLREIETDLEHVDAQIIGIVQREVRIMAAYPGRRVHAGDILMIEAEASSLTEVLSILGLKLAESVDPAKEALTPESAEGQVDGADDALETETGAKAQKVDKPEAASVAGKSVDIELMELVVLPGSVLAGRSARDILLRTRYGINLLALSREGQRVMKRLRSVQLQSGDLLLMQGPAEAINEFASDNACVPLAQRELRIPNLKKIWQASLIMCVAVVAAAFGLVPASISFGLGVLLSMVLRTVPPRQVYASIDWSVVVLLGALIPVAGAMETSGTAQVLAHLLIDNIAQGQPLMALALILLVTMFLSDLMNNAATAAVMCPIAIGTAAALQVNADAFLMAVAVGASCAFLTPIGHQNNTLILGPGGFRFGDYWRLGLPLELLVMVVSMPLLVTVWPL
jgi:di/tricarboxylate transporter